MTTLNTTKVNIFINDKPYSCNSGISILDACKQAGYDIPTLCYLKDLNPAGSCRVCVVEVAGARSLVASCVYPINEGIKIYTSTPRVLKARKTTLELMLSNHNSSCNSCVRSTNCELQKLSQQYGCDEMHFKGAKLKSTIDVTDYLERDNSKCILCRRCVAACKNQKVAVIGANDRGYHTNIGSAFDQSLSQVPCVACGQCITVCPTGALKEKDDTHKIEAALADKSKHVVVATAPAVRVALGEEFGLAIGTNVEGKMVAALKLLGFNKVFDVNFAADVTIMEEGTEFLGRLNEGVLPMLTSCSPGWINFIEQYHPELLPNLSTVKSPQQIYGGLVKTYYAEKHNIDPKDIYVVSVMPCVAKKTEILRDHQNAAGEDIKDIDCVITTRELARMIKRNSIKFESLADERFDAFMGEGSTAALIFGTTGGVMEAALRTVKEVVEGKSLEKIEFEAVRGTSPIKKATVEVGGKKINIAVVNGIKNADIVMKEIKSGKSEYHFVEVMCCPGGCVTGGGQPIQPADILNESDLKQLRAAAMYNADSKANLRKSHLNTEVKALYNDYLGSPNSEKAHHILHTKYTNRKK